MYACTYEHASVRSFWKLFAEFFNSEVLGDLYVSYYSYVYAYEYT